MKKIERKELKKLKGGTDEQVGSWCPGSAGSSCGFWLPMGPHSAQWYVGVCDSNCWCVGANASHLGPECRLA